MTTEQGIENWKSPPASDNPREENAFEDTKNNDVSTELCNGIGSLQYHLDVYQGKNFANIDIVPIVCHLPTTQKAVAKVLLKD